LRLHRLRRPRRKRRRSSNQLQPSPPPMRRLPSRIAPPSSSPLHRSGRATASSPCNLGRAAGGSCSADVIGPRRRPRIRVKRSDREGRWADIRSARTRFAAEAAFLILVAAGAALARLSPVTIILLMLVASVLVALIERASSRIQARVPTAAEVPAAGEEPAAPLSAPKPEPVRPGPVVTRRPLELAGLEEAEAEAVRAELPP